MGIDFTGGSLFMVLLLFAAGLLCIIKGGDLFVDAASWIAEASGIPKFIIGATVVSFATTMPEMLVSVFAALQGNADIAVGNAVGSVTANVGLIMCVALICMECAMTRRQFGVKACLLLAAILALFGFTRDGQLSVLESVLILVIFVGFLVESLIAARQEQGSELPAQEEKAAEMPEADFDDASLIPPEEGAADPAHRAPSAQRPSVRGKDILQTDCWGTAASPAPPRQKFRPG